MFLAGFGLWFHGRLASFSLIDGYTYIFLSEFTLGSDPVGRCSLHLAVRKKHVKLVDETVIHHYLAGLPRSADCVQSSYWRLAIWIMYTGESCSHIRSPGRLARCTLYGVRPWFWHQLTPFEGGTLRTESKRFFSISSAEKNVFQNDSGLPGAGSSNFKDPGHRSVSTNERLSSTPRLPNSLTMKNFLKDDDACTECGGAGDGMGQPFAEQTSS